MMIYGLVELWRLVSYQLRGSLLLLVSILLMCRPRDGHLSLQYHCINTNQMVRTEEYLSAPQFPLAPPLSLSSRNPILVSGCFI